MSAVQELGKGEAFNQGIDISIFEDDNRTFSTKLQDDWREMIGGGFHDDLTDLRTTGEKEEIEGLS